MTGSESHTAEDHARNYALLQWTLIAVGVVFVLFSAYDRSGSDPANSRLATIFSLTRDGSFYIDRPLDEDPNPFEQRTIDKVMVRGERINDAVHGGRLISSKPPILTLLMTGEYIVMNRLFGWDLDDPDEVERMLMWMTITLVGGGYLLALVLFRKTVAFLTDDPFVCTLLLGCLAFCTQLWGYSSLLNNHVPAVGMLMIALYVCVGIATGRLDPSPWLFVAFGFGAAMVLTIDLPVTVFPAVAGLYLAWRFPRQAIPWVIVGAFVPLAVHFGIMYGITGSLLPVQVRGELYHFQSSFWRYPIQMDALNEPRLTYIATMTIGRKGIFLLYPVLLFGIIGALYALARSELTYRRLVLAGLAGFLLMGLYYGTRTNNYGGECYGFRWFIGAMPVLMLMATPVMPHFKRGWRWAIVALLIGVSFYSAYESTGVGWRASQEWTCRYFGPSY